MSLFGPPNIEKMESKGDIKGLIKALGYLGDAGDIKKKAANSLTKLGPKAIDQLLKEIMNGNEEIRVGVVYVLGDIKDTRAVQPLIKRLNDNSIRVRVNAAISLGNIGDPLAIDPLFLALNDSTNSLRTKAAEALVKFGRKNIEILVQLIQNEHEEIQLIASTGLLMAGKSSVDFLLPLLRNPTFSIRKSVINVIEKLGWTPQNEQDAISYWLAKEKIDKCIEIGESGVEYLIKELLTSYDDSRKLAAKALGIIKVPLSISPLITALMDNNECVRDNASEALSKFGSLAVDSLIQLLSNGNDQSCKYAARVLGLIGDPKAVNPLINILAERDQSLRRTVVYALGNIGDLKAVDPLIQALDDSNWEVREAAVEALVKIKDYRANEWIILKCNEGKIRRETAIKALKLLGDYPIVKLFCFFLGTLGHGRSMFIGSEVWVNEIRKQTKIPDAEIILVDEWNPPYLVSTDIKKINEVLPKVQYAVENYLQFHTHSFRNNNKEVNPEAIITVKSDLVVFIYSFLERKIGV